MLTAYSKIKVKLATEVLSQSVAIAVQESGNEDVQFCTMKNYFFDCTNMRSRTEYVRKIHVMSIAKITNHIFDQLKINNF